MKYTFNKINFLRYSEYGSHHYFKGYTILKDEFLIIGIENNILIFDILLGQQLNTYKLFSEGEDNLFGFEAKIKKWNNNNNNNFIIDNNGNIILFEKTDDNELKIIGQSYFKNIECLKRFNEKDKDNKFYDDGSDENFDSSRWGLFSNERNDNKPYSVSMFY